MQIERNNEMSRIEQSDWLRIAPKICHRLMSRAFNRKNSRGTVDWRSDSPMGSSVQPVSFNPPSSGKSFSDEETCPRGSSLARSPTSRDRWDFAFVRSSRLIRDILPRLGSRLPLVAPSPPFSFFHRLAVPILGLWNFPPAGKLLGSWLGRKSLKESRRMSRGKSFRVEI